MFLHILNLGDFGPKAPDISLLLFYGTAYQRFLAATLATYSVARPSSSLTLPRVRPSALLRLMNPSRRVPLDPPPRLRALFRLHLLVPAQSPTR